VFHYTTLKNLARNKHCRLLGPFVSYKDNEALFIKSQEPFVSYKDNEALFIKSQEPT
jgi:hypothetical protein